MTVRLPGCIGVIPARFQSSRFPGKPLAEILGRPMFLHVHERASRCKALERVVLATDDDRIFAAAQKHGVEAVMTRPDHPSGTDRVHEAALLTGAQPDSVIVNIQGDEPALEPAMLDQLTAPFADPAVRVTTLARRITVQQAQNPDQVKAVFSTVTGDALYFSRAPVPHDRDGTSAQADADRSGFWGHVGLYAFRMDALERFTQLPPGQLEQREKLEQLRFLENGIPIRVVPTTHCCHGVDRPEDIAIIESILGDTI